LTLKEPLETGHVESLFGKLSDELCLHIIKYLSLSDFQPLAMTCKRWARLTRDDEVFRELTIERFRVDRGHQLRMGFESQERGWRDMFVRLDEGRTVWKGFALDSSTNVFLPYPMELIVSATAIQLVGKRSMNLMPAELWRKTEFEGFCRWSSLQNALTRVEGLILDDLYSDRFTMDPWLKSAAPRTVVFEETEILRGTNIAVPNKYYGIIAGPVMIGMYDPSGFLGSFIVIMEESLSTLHHPEPLTKPIQTKQSYRGLLTYATLGEKKGFHIELSFDSIDKQNMYQCNARIHILSNNLSEEGLWLTLKLQGQLDDLQGREKNATFTFEHSIVQSTDAWIQERWLSEHIPLNEQFLTLMRYGNYLIGMFPEPKIGCFYVNL
jgi:hypothetical protein